MELVEEFGDLRLTYLLPLSAWQAWTVKRKAEMRSSRMGCHEVLGDAEDGPKVVNCVTSSMTLMRHCLRPAATSGRAMTTWTRRSRSTVSIRDPRWWANWRSLPMAMCGSSSALATALSAFSCWSQKAESRVYCLKRSRCP